MSTRKVERPCVRRSTWSAGVVRASSSIRSEWSAREVQIFWPWTSQPPSDRVAVVWIDVVSEPAVGSVTPKACSRSSPDAMRGRYRRFCSSEPWRRIVPIVYICAWHAPLDPPEALISSRITLAAVRESPAPPYSSGTSAASQPFSVSARTNSSGYVSGSSPRQYSPGKREQSSRTAARISASSSGARKSTARSRAARGDGGR